MDNRLDPVNDEAVTTRDLDPIATRDRRRRATRRPGRPPTTTPLELVGLSEAAELLGITTAALTNRRRASGRRPGDSRGLALAVPVPDPIAELKCGPIWDRRQIQAYTIEHNERRWARPPSIITAAGR